jgi:hypothetical protein
VLHSQVVLFPPSSQAPTQEPLCVPLTLKDALSGTPLRARFEYSLLRCDSGCAPSVKTFCCTESELTRTCPPGLLSNNFDSLSCPSLLSFRMGSWALHTSQYQSTDLFNIPQYKEELQKSQLLSNLTAATTLNKHSTVPSRLSRSVFSYLRSPRRAVQFLGD